MSKNVFITGSDGFIGAELVSACTQQGFSVTCADARSGIDIRSKDIADHIPDGVDAVIHLASLSNDTVCKNNGYACFDVNVLGTLNLMDAAEKKHAKQFIFASTEWVYDNCNEENIKDEESVINIANHTSEYALSKLVSEANLRQKHNSGFCPVTVLRFGIVCGTVGEKRSAVESLFLSVKEKEEVSVGSLRTGRCFIHARDIASGIIRSIGLGGFTIINLAGDELVRLGEILDLSKKILGKEIKITESNPNAVSVRNISNKRAKNILHWNPSVTVEAWLRELKNNL